MSVDGYSYIKSIGVAYEENNVAWYARVEGGLPARGSWPCGWS